MCEIILIFYIQKQLGEIVERGGRDSTLIRILFVVSWIVAELLALVIGFAITDNAIGAGFFAIFAVVTVTVLFFIIANTLPPVDTRRRGGKRTYMDDYYEYNATGRVDTRPEYDPEEEDDLPRRRKKRRDPEEDDAPRYEDRRRNDRREDIREEDEKRPRRKRRREDEDY